MVKPMKTSMLPNGMMVPVMTLSEAGVQDPSLRMAGLLP
jgi:hypothetical protein